MQEFHVWLQGQMDMPGRNWSKSDLARKSGIDTGTISNLLNEVRKPGVEICRDLATAFGLPQAVVFYHAGLITEDPRDPRELPAPALDVLRWMEQANGSQREAIKAIVKSYFDGVRGLDGQGNRGSSGNADGQEPSRT